MEYTCFSHYFDIGYPALEIFLKNLLSNNLHLQNLAAYYIIRTSILKSEIGLERFCCSVYRKNVIHHHYLILRPREVQLTFSR